MEKNVFADQLKFLARYDVMGPRISAARKQLETRIKNDELYRESERKLAKDFKRQIDNWWRLQDEVCGQ